jgi:nickel-dependent lactate racemase
VQPERHFSGEDEVTATNVELPYGSGAIPLTLPDGARRIDLEPAKLPLPDVPEKILRRALDQPIGAPPLRELARGRRSAAILIPGKTRVAGTADTVPALLAELRAAGLSDDCISVHLATGTHEHHFESDLKQLIGEEVAGRIRCVAHACQDPETLTPLGRTRAGTPVAISTAVLEADLRILTGRIVPHYFAGFSGGRKALVPGVAGFDTICANHRLTLAEERGLHPGVAPCSLADNPVHRDMVEAAAMAGPDYCLNTAHDTRGRLTFAVAGDWQAAFAAGCEIVERHFRLLVEEPVDVLITSPGGAPHDCNFMQAIKAVLNLRSVLRPGGHILWLAECGGGIHPGFLRWATIEDDSALERAVRSDYALTGHNAIMLRRLVREAQVELHSGLPEADVRRMGFVPVASPQAALDEIARGQRDGFRAAVAACANVICAAPGPGR